MGAGFTIGARLRTTLGAGSTTGAGVGATDAAGASAKGEGDWTTSSAGFVTRLTQAVEQQARVALHAATQAERAAALVRGHDVRAAALRKLVERRVHEGRRVAARHEQKQSDEHSARVAWLRVAAQHAERDLSRR